LSKEQESESTVSRNQSIKEEEMAEEKEAPKRVSRRQFVKGAAVGGAGVAAAGVLASCAPAAAPAPGETAAPAPTCPPAGECAPCPTPWLPEKWDYEADVVVVGYGGAGAIAAISAYDAGAKVLMLEKCPADTPDEVLHTPSTRYSGNSQKEWIGSIEDAVTFLRHCTAEMVPDDVLEAYATKWVENLEFMESIGGTPYTAEITSGGTDFPSDAPGFTPGESMVNVTHLPREEWSKDYYLGAPPAWAMYSGAVNERGIEVLYGTPAKRLIYDPVMGEVVGVEAETAGAPVFVKAKKAVALTCGGFQHNTRMKMEAFKNAHIEFYANPGNTGDGHIMAQSVGAEMVHMPCVSGKGGIMRFPGQPSAARCQLYKMLGDGGIVCVDQYGKRYGNEEVTISGHTSFVYALAWDQERIEYTRIPHWEIFDEILRKDGGTLSDLGVGKLGVTGTKSGMAWSDGSEDEIAKGWILTGATIGELAEKIAAHPENSGKMTVATLQETIDKYNEYCAQGSDLEFGRSKENLLPLTAPPYYAIAGYPGGPNTQGGPRKNAKCQVLRADDTVVKRLYVGGENSSLNTVAYPMKNCTELIITGRIAGENAAAEEPWV